MKKVFCVLLLILVVGSSAYAFDVNKQDENGETFLHRAVRNSDATSVMQLIVAGANPLIENNAGVSPLELAIQIMENPTSATAGIMKPLPPMYNYWENDNEKKIKELEYKIELLNYDNKVLVDELKKQKSQTTFIALFVMVFAQEKAYE